jgi:hypothetical protein
MLGNFHIELAFYGALGSYIDGSWIEYILTESGVLAEGSVMGFLKGKFYNRCARLHELVATVMEQKLYASFYRSLTEDDR